ncbi:MAG: response regulator [Lachnospiraceae bacterium]|nr:response regulator [Lachnospiraceae bacterium]
MGNDHKYSILIVDDESSNIKALTYILKNDYSIYVEINGQDAISTAEELLPDIILLDVIMPEMDGYEVITALKKSKRTKDIPVIFISGLSDHEAEEKGLSLGAADYIIKPFSSVIVKLRVGNQVKILKQSITESDLLKYKMTGNALNIALWDMDIIVSDPVNPENIFTWSKEFRNILGFTDENDFPNLLQSWSERIHPDDRERALEAFKAHMVDETGQTPYNLEYRLMLRNGTYRYFHAFGDTLRDSSGAPLKAVGAIMDINERVQNIANIQRLAKERAEAEFASQAKSSFLANMSHEIRTPMNTILGVTEIMLQEAKLPAGIEDGLDKIYNACNLLLGIINDILDFSKIEAGKLDILPSEYEIASLINDVVHMNIMRIEGRPIEFELIVDENTPSKLIGDELRIKQILNNIISNAFKYTDEGKVTLSVKWDTSKDEPHIVFGVKDTGHGMTPEQLKKMFDEYSRFAQADGKRTIEGTGLGLAITQSLLELMNGKFSVESEVKVGTSFTVSLPQEVVGIERIGKELAKNLNNLRYDDVERKKKAKLKREPMPYGKVLIVDDVESNLLVAMGLMKPYRLLMDSVSSGPLAIEKIEDGNEYDIIFMDHMMPGMDGIEATKHLRDSGYQGTIIALTANAVHGQAELFLKNGFDAFVSKPIDVRQLDAVLNKFIRDKQPEEVILKARSENERKNSGEEQPKADLLVVKSFIRDANKALEIFDDLLKRDALNEKEGLNSFVVTVHGIKSALKNIKEIKLSERAFDLEQAGRNQNINLIKERIISFLDELREMLKKLEIHADDEKAKAADDIDDIDEKLKLAKEMCADYNRKGALDILSSLKIKDSEKKACLNTAIEHLYLSEFDKAEEALENILKRAKKISDWVIEGIDIKAGLEKFDDEKTYIKLLKTYKASVESLLSSLAAVDQDSLREYEINIHGIKGSSLGVMADGLSGLASKLEQAAKNQDLSYINEHNSVFLKTADKFLKELEEMFVAYELLNPKPKKAKPDEEVLIKLGTACANYSMTLVDEAMEIIEAYEYTDDDGLSEWLKDKVSLMKFDEVVGRLANSSEEE